MKISTYFNLKDKKYSSHRNMVCHQDYQQSRCTLDKFLEDEIDIKRARRITIFLDKKKSTFAF